MAQVDYYLKLDGIDGECADSKHKAWIELESWSWGESNSGGFGSGTSGGGAGKVMMQDFHFVASMSKASPKLMQACAGGTHIPHAELECCKAGETAQPFLKIKFTEIVVTSLQTGGSAHSELIPTDQVSLGFAKIEVAYGAQDAKGKVNALDQKMGWNVVENKKV